MSEHDPVETLRQMLKFAEDAVDIMGDLDSAAFEEEYPLTLAITRLLEVIGEAANRLPSEFRRHYIDIPWRAAIGLRNRLIHAYDVVELPILWRIVNQDLPTLISDLRRIITELEPEGREST